MRISDWSSDVCSSDLSHQPAPPAINSAGRPNINSRVRQLAVGTASAVGAGSGKGSALGAALAGAAFSALGFLAGRERSEEHTSELQSLMRISYAVFCLKKKKTEQHRCRRQLVREDA